MYIAHEQLPQNLLKKKKRKKRKKEEEEEDFQVYILLFLYIIFLGKEGFSTDK